MEVMRASRGDKVRECDSNPVLSLFFSFSGFQLFNPLSHFLNAWNAVGDQVNVLGT